MKSPLFSWVIPLMPSLSGALGNRLPSPPSSVPSLFFLLSYFWLLHLCVFSVSLFEPPPTPLSPNSLYFFRFIRLLRLCRRLPFLFPNSAPPFFLLHPCSQLPLSLTLTNTPFCLYSSWSELHATAAQMVLTLPPNLTSPTIIGCFQK